MKMTEQLSAYKAIAQAEADAEPDDIPVVFHKRNRKRWLVILDASDFMNLLGAEEE